MVDMKNKERTNVQTTLEDFRKEDVAKPATSN